MISKSTKLIFKWSEFKKSDQWDQILTRETCFSCIYSQNTPSQAKSARGTDSWHIWGGSISAGFRAACAPWKEEPADWETGAQLLKRKMSSDFI